MSTLLQLAGLEGLLAFGFTFLVVVLGILFVLGIVYVEHRKEMKLIEEGATEHVAEDDRAWILAVGLLLLAVGIGSILETAVATGQVSDGITLTLVGLATLTDYAIKRRQSTTAPDETAPDDDVERTA